MTDESPPLHQPPRSGGPHQRRRVTRRPVERPATSFDTGLQHERTALAWERTAIATMVAGVVLSRFGATSDQAVVAAFGLAQTAFGAAILIWAGAHYDDLHGPLREGADVVHPFAARFVGAATVAATGVALVAATVTTLR